MNVSTHLSRSTVLVRWVKEFNWAAFRRQYGMPFTTRRRFAAEASMAAAVMGSGALPGLSVIANG